MQRGCRIAIVIAVLLFVAAAVAFISFLGNLSDRPTYGSPAPAGDSNTVTGSEVRDPKEIVYCDVLRDEATGAQCDYYTKIWSKLEVGSGGVEFPPSIVRDETATISFAITRDPTDAPLDDVLGSAPDRRVTLKIGRFMAAQLQGDGFRIDPAGLQQRDLFVGNATRWDWRVTPVKARNHRLLLSAYVVVEAADGSRKESLLKTLELPLAVDVTWGQRLGDVLDDSQAWLTKGTNWLRALTVFLVALGGLFAVFRRKKPAASTSQADPPA